MNRNHLLQITNELYRLTLLFPKKEPLRYKMRELADGILADLIRRHFSDKTLAEKKLEKVMGDLGALDSFFEIAKAQNWIKLSDILNLQKEYSKIKKELIKERHEKIQIEPGQISPPVQIFSAPSEEKMTISDRQQKILAILKEKEKVQVREIKKTFPQISKRTLRRDFKDLLNQGLIERKGERSNTFYQLKVGHSRT